MSRKSRENKLNDNMEQLNKVVGDLGRGFDHVQRSIQDALKSTSENVKLQQETLKIFQEQNKIIQEQNDRNFRARQQQRAYDDRIRRQNEARSKAEKILAEADKGNIKTLNERLKIQNQIDNINERAKNLIQNNLDDQEKINKILRDRDTLNRKNIERLKEIEKLDKAQTKSEARKDAVNKIVSTVTGANSNDAEMIKNGSYKWKVITDVFAKAVDVFKTSVKEGINANYNATEETLNKIITMNSQQGKYGWDRGTYSSTNISGFTTDKSYKGYIDLNNTIIDQLNADNLQDNIKNTDVKKAVADLMSAQGFGYEQAIAKGYQDTVIKYIVPYLDTTSEAFNNLEMIMPRYV